MLQRIRDNASGPAVYVVVGLITLVFGVWGIGSYFTPSANPVVASVGKTEITRYQLQRAYDQNYRRLRARMGDNFDPGDFDPDQLRRSILQQLVNQAILDQYAVGAGYRTTDRALLQALATNPQFQRDGEFSAERYQTTLSRAGIEPGDYEARLRRDLISDQVRTDLVKGSFVAPPAVVHAYSVRNQKRDVAYLQLPADAYVDEVKIDSEEVEDWFADHRDQYKRPERVKLDYVMLDQEELDTDDAPSTATLQSLYEDNKERFSTPEERDMQQLFVPVSPGAEDAARQTIQSLARELEQGADFDDIAAETDAAVEATQRYGVTREDLPSAVAQALFSLEDGELSLPIHGEDGWYLVKTTSIQPGETQPFDAPEVQEQLKQMARTQTRNRRFGELSERMESLAVQAPNSLDVLADELNLDIRSTDWITRDKGPGLGSNEGVRQAAFSEDVLDAGLNSSVIQIEDGKQVVVRVAEHETAEQLPLEEVADKVRTHLREQKARELARQAAQQVLQEMQDDTEALGDIVDSTPGTLQQPGFIDRTSTAVPAAVRTAAFALHEPQEGSASHDIIDLDNGDVALVMVRDVKIPEVDRDDVESFFVQGQKAYTAQLEFAAFTDYLVSNADVTVKSNRVNETDSTAD